MTPEPFMHALAELVAEAKDAGLPTETGRRRTRGDGRGDPGVRGRMCCARNVLRKISEALQRQVTAMRQRVQD